MEGEGYSPAGLADLLERSLGEIERVIADLEAAGLVQVNAIH